MINTLFNNRKPVRKILPSSLSANYIRFRRGQMVFVALVSAIVGAATVAAAWALSQ